MTASSFNGKEVRVSFLKTAGLTFQKMTQTKKRKSSKLFQLKAKNGVHLHMLMKIKMMLLPNKYLIRIKKAASKLSKNYKLRYRMKD